MVSDESLDDGWKTLHVVVDADSINSTSLRSAEELLFELRVAGANFTILDGGRVKLIDWSVSLPACGLGVVDGGLGLNPALLDGSALSGGLGLGLIGESRRQVGGVIRFSHCN
jgi:hypothetical protein